MQNKLNGFDALDKITRTHDRIKQTGEVFTPLDLVDEILDKIPQEMFTDPNKTFLDPAAGDGNFLVRVVQRKIDNGSTPIQALQTTFGVEMMEDNTEECWRRLVHVALANDPSLNIEELLDIVQANVICRNSLEWDFDHWQPLLTADEV